MGLIGTSPLAIAVFLDVVLAIWALLHLGFVSSHDFRRPRKLILIVTVLMELTAIAFWKEFNYDVDALATKYGSWLTYIFLLASYQINVIAVQTKLLMLFLFWRSLEYFKQFAKLGAFPKQGFMRILFALSGILYIAGLVHSGLSKNPQSPFDWGSWLALSYFNYKLSEFVLEPFTDRTFKFLMGFVFMDMICFYSLFLFDVAIKKWSTQSQYGLSILMIITLIASKFLFLGSTGFAPQHVLYSLRHRLFRKPDPLHYDMKKINFQKNGEGSKEPSKNENPPEEYNGGGALVLSVEAEPIQERPSIPVQRGIPSVHVGGLPPAQMGYERSVQGAFVSAAAPVAVAPMGAGMMNQSMPRNVAGQPPVMGNPVQAVPPAAVSPRPVPGPQYVPPRAAVPPASIPMAAVPPAAAASPRPGLAYHASNPGAAMFPAQADGDGEEMGEAALPRPVDVEVVGQYNVPMIYAQGREKAVSIVSANDHPSGAMGDAVAEAMARPPQLKPVPRQSPAMGDAAAPLPPAQARPQLKPVPKQAPAKF
jgi:hypothetical protein